MEASFSIICLLIVLASTCHPPPRAAHQQREAENPRKKGHNQIVKEQLSAELDGESLGQIRCFSNQNATTTHRLKYP